MVARKTTFPVKLVLSFTLMTGALSGCGVEGPVDSDESLDPFDVDRHAAIPGDRAKVTPQEDPTPPILHSLDFQDPVPLPVISTAGAEDAPFIPAGREELYFFFAADVRQDPGIQILNPANGIWRSRRVGAEWEEAILVPLQDPGQLALNGCPFVGEGEMFFCSAREGYTGLNWFRATKENGRWANWQEYQFDPTLEVGELHIHGDELYYGSERGGGMGGADIWMATRVDGIWQEPVNLEAVNSDDDDTRPYLTPDGDELWITRTYEGSPAILRSRKVDGAWSEAELIVSRFAGEPTLDSQGNLYFVHHFYENGVMLEADIYVAYRK